MKKTSVLLILIWSLIQIGISQSNGSITLADIPLRKHFDASTCNGGIQSWAFDQDSSGILYVANNEGLLEFDGSKWKRYEVPFCTKVRAVKVDKQNRVFVGGQGQFGYFLLTKNGFTFNSLIQQLPAHFQNVAETWKILEHNNKIFFNTESQLIVLEDTNLKVLGIPGYMRLAFKVENQLLVQFYDIGLFEFVNNEFIPLLGTKDIPEIISILPKKDGYYYFSKVGLVFEDDKFGISLVDLPFEIGEINDAKKLSSGEYVIGTQNNGLYIFNTDFTFKKHLNKNEGLSGRTVKTFYEDEFHNLWVALNNGIDYLELSLPLSLINDEIGLEGTGYASCKYQDQIYLGTNNGLFIQETSTKNLFDSQYKLIPGSEGQVYKFSLIADELILCHNRGAFQIKGNQINQFHDIGSWMFLQTTVPDLVLGGDYQGISLFTRKKSKWLKIGKIPDLNESSRLMEFENDSILWMTHGSKGAYRMLFDEHMNIKSKIDFFGEKSGFPSNIMISVYSLNDKLVFTAENGIYNFNHDSYSFAPNSFFNKWLGTKHVSSIASNGSNTIYYIQDQKLGLLVQENYGTYRKRTELFKHINKMINDDLPNITLLDKHNVLIGAKEGFIRYDPEKEFIINDDFHVNIRSVEVISSKDSSETFYPSFIANKEITINQSLKFQYAAPFFDGFEELQYSYRLLPLDENWSKWIAQNEKEYPYLPSGKYSFEVKGKNVYGLESPAASFSFIVLKPWYLSNFAVVMYFILGFVILALVPIVQRKRHRREKSIIYKNKEQALNLKDDEINQISKESKDEINRLTNEKLRTEINLKNDQLTTTTMHLMSNNEFIQDIRKKIDAYLYEGGDERNLRETIKIIDNNLEDSDSWNQFAYHFDQVHGDYLKKLSKNNISLSPREIKLAAFLRMNMSSKEISNLMNISIRGVELARHRLRKKLQLDRDQNLVEYLIELDND